MKRLKTSRQIQPGSDRIEINLPDVMRDAFIEGMITVPTIKQFVEHSLAGPVLKHDPINVKDSLGSIRKVPAMNQNRRFFLFVVLINKASTLYPF